jgi:S1-C subfamily serine protease
MKRLSRWLIILTLLAMASMACRFSLPGASTSSGAPAPVQAVTVVVTPPASQPLPSEPIDYEYQDNLLTTLYERVNPGIVSIQVLSQMGGSLGSGFVYDKAGHIVTNYHVIENARDLEVAFPSGIKVRGSVIGNDLDSDLAVIKVDAPEDALFPLPLSNSDQLKVGQTVVAIGNPFGLSGTMTVGIISARGRTLESMRVSPGGRPFTAGGIIQTDAAINPGNSGGPLLNLRGEVVGVNRAIRTTAVSPSGEPSNSGVGFAIPSNIVNRVVPVLIEQGNYDYPYLGVSSMDEITLLQQETLGLPQATGAYISEVVPGGPADQAGLRGGTRQTSDPRLQSGGDLIIAIDDRPVRVFGDLLAYLMENKSPGDPILLTILRGNEQMEVTVTLDRRP